MNSISKKDLPVPLEDAECQTFVQYLEMQKNRGIVAEFTHTANETYTTSMKQKSRNKAMGVRRGIHDYVIVLRVPSYSLALVEMKRLRGSTTSKEQKSWNNSVNKCPGVHGAICKGAAEAIAFIEFVTTRP